MVPYRLAAGTLEIAFQYLFYKSSCIIFCLNQEGYWRMYITIPIPPLTRTVISCKKEKTANQLDFCVCKKRETNDPFLEDDAFNCFLFLFWLSSSDNLWKGFQEWNQFHLYFKYCKLFPHFRSILPVCQMTGCKEHVTTNSNIRTE